MEHYDEELLAARRNSECQKYTTLETGIYAGDPM